MKYNQILSSIFIAVICLPVLTLALGVQTKTSNSKENSQLAEFPKIEFNKEFPNKASEYFSEHFGLRHDLIQLYNAWKVELLKESSNPKVVLGKDGWLFLRDTLDHFDKIPLTNDELDHWVDTLEQQSKWVEDQGSDFLFVLTPTKATIYPEFIPKNWKSQRSSHADQIVAHLKKNSEVKILDLRKVLLGKKSEGLLYDKTDTHWNDRGAAIAASVILGEIQIESKQVSSHEFELQDDFAGDLSNLLMMQSKFNESAVRLKDQSIENWELIETDERVLNINGLSRPILKTISLNKKFPKVMIFRDSFCDALLKFIAPHFSEGIYIWRNHELDSKKISSNQPEIVIQQMTERFLPRRPEFKP